STKNPFSFKLPTAVSDTPDTIGKPCRFHADFSPSSPLPHGMNLHGARRSPSHVATIVELGGVSGPPPAWHGVPDQPVFQRPTGPHGTDDDRLGEPAPDARRMAPFLDERPAVPFDAVSHPWRRWPGVVEHLIGTRIRQTTSAWRGLTHPSRVRSAAKKAVRCPRQARLLRCAACAALTNASNLTAQGMTATRHRNDRCKP